MFPCTIYDDKNSRMIEINSYSHTSRAFNAHVIEFDIDEFEGDAIEIEKDCGFQWFTESEIIHFIGKREMRDLIAILDGAPIYGDF